LTRLDRRIVRSNPSGEVGELLGETRVSFRQLDSQNISPSESLIVGRLTASLLLLRFHLAKPLAESARASCMRSRLK
jgi:hypothetical protein